MSTKDPREKSSSKGPGSNSDDAWTDAPLDAVPLPDVPDDFDFPELDAVLSDPGAGSGDEDTGSDLPRGVAGSAAGDLGAIDSNAPADPFLSDAPLAPQESASRSATSVASKPAGQPAERPAAAAAAPAPTTSAAKKPAASSVVVTPPVLPQAGAETELGAGAETELGSVLDDRASFTAEARRLARAREWPSLAALTSAALDHSPWASQAETRMSLLADLARLYRDRLRDLPSAEDQFRRLVEVAPADVEANQFLAQRYREAANWRALHDLRLNAADATWDPERRLEWTREAARIASDELRAEELAIAAWERLWRSGDAQQEAARALSDGYRRAGLWDRLAEFLVRRADDKSGAERTVLLREAAEAYLTGDRDHDSATQVLARVLEANPDDPLALLGRARVLARRSDWPALAELGTRGVAPAREAAFADVRRVAADALWNAGEHERAVAVYDCILASDPTDVDGLRAKEEHLLKRGDVDQLVTLLGTRAQQTEDAAARARLLERAADLAARELGDPRRAAALLEQRATIEAGRAEALDRLVEIYEALDEHESLRRVLEERLELVRNRSDRVELLRRLGDHCVRRLGDDARGESCWREIIDTVPDDRTVREELIALYRRRGDFEAVDRAWSAFAWRPLDDESLAAIWRAAAVNLQENVADAGRSVRAWRRVLDLLPDDPTARLAIVTQLRATDDRPLLVDALDARSQAADADERLALWAEVARLSERDGATTAALAAYERILCAAPGDGAALEALARLYGAERAGVARSALELAVARSDRGAHAALVRRTLPLIAAGDALDRLLTLRRLMALGPMDAELVAELTAAAGETRALGTSVALFEELAATASDLETRNGHHQRLAALYEEAGDPVKALLTLSAARQRVPTSLAELAPLLRLAETTGRHEDAFALLGVAAAVEAPAEVRRAALRLRQQLAQQQLNDPTRAFHQAAWLVRLDADDRQAIADAEELARAAGAWRDLDGLYAELWDRARTSGERVELARKRRELRAGELRDPLGALDLTLLMYRLTPSDELAAELWQRAEPLSAWSRVAAAIEGRLRQGVAGSAALTALGDIVAGKLNDAPHAFELYGAAFVAEPTAAELGAKLVETAAMTQQPLRLAQRLREAAARATSPLGAIELYRQAAARYAASGDQEQALDVHRRILQLQPRELESYEIGFTHLRKNGMWRELRDLLEQRLEVDEAGDEGAQMARRLEMARICRDPLRDLQTALRTYAAILERHPDHEEALAGVRALTDGASDPRLELERLRLELARAAGARRVEILLAMAELQERALDDAQGALATTRQLVAESGPGGAGYAPMLRLLERVGAWTEAIDLMQARAAIVTDRRERIELLRAAVAVAQAHSVARPRLETLTQELLSAAPDDAQARARLLDTHRKKGRYPELDLLLAETLARLAPGEALDARRLLVAERLRLLEHALGRVADAEALAHEEIELRASDEDLQLWLASSLRRRGDQAGYAAMRRQQVALMPPRLGALVLCDLAESAHATVGNEAAIACYREARALDPDNRFAAEGLKALGRRSRNWRATASLLPDEDAGALAPAARAARLVERAVAVAAASPTEAIDYYERAIAIDPDAVGAWDGLAALQRTLGDTQAAYRSTRAALLAEWRSTAPDPGRIVDDARRFGALATLAFACDDAAVGALLAERAYELDPSLPTPALAVARSAQSEGRTSDARAILGAVLARAGELTPAQRLDASYRLGVLVARSGSIDDALTHLRDGLRIDPLHPGLLNAVAEVLVQKRRIVAAIQHYLQALMLAHDGRRRGQLYARIGTLWEQSMHSVDEAGVCYELAVAHGVDDSEVMLRALSHYRQTGRHAEAARIIDQLLPRATTPSALAALWTERGALLAASDDASAVDAFDMALSYDPSCRAAVDGLAQLLERRGEWQQLIELLEPRVDSGAADQRADMLRRLAMIARARQNDLAAAEGFLRRAVALHPTVADYDQLLALLADDDARQLEREELTAARLGLAGPFTPVIVQTGLRLTAEGRRRWAWVVLSPLMTTIIQDAALKSLVLELRREFEKADTLGMLTPGLHRQLLPAALSAPLLDVLAELDALVPFGPTTPEAAKAGRIGRVDAKTVLGRSFAAIAAQLGIADAVLTRADDLPVACRVIDDVVPHVIVRGDLFAMLSPMETTAMLALMLEQSRPGARMLSSLPADEAGRVVAALFAAVGRRPQTDELGPLCQQIVAAAGRDRLERWSAELSASDDLADRVPAAVAELAARVALFAAGEVRFACKLLSRIDGKTQLPTTGKLEELDRYFGEAESARKLLAFAISPAFGALLPADDREPTAA